MSETYIEKTADGERHSHGIRYRNPTDNAVVLDLSTPADIRRSDGRFIPPREWIVTVPPHESVVLPDRDGIPWAIHSTSCIEGKCDERKGRRECRNPKHRKMIMGGLAPQLIREDDTSETLHPALEGKAIAVTANDDAARDARLLERARKAGAK